MKLLSPILILLFSISAISSEANKLCNKFPEKVVQVKKLRNALSSIKNHKGEETWDNGQPEPNETDLNFDGKKDLFVDHGYCGTGGCMEAVYLNCGNDKKYYVLFPPEYYSDTSGWLEPYKKEVTKVNGTKWKQIRRTSYWQKHPKLIVLGYRYQFDGENYVVHFNENEYLHLIKLANKGKDFAIEQLIESAYAKLVIKYEHPDLKSIRAELMKPALIEKIQAEPSLEYYIGKNKFQKFLKNKEKK
jgi:hypothetical protein